MKKLFALMLAVVMLFAVTACSKNGNNETTKPDSEVTQGSESNNTADAESALDVLTNIWNAYGDEKFGVMGGDFSEENMTENAPGKYSTADAEAFSYDLVFPAASVELITDAASLKHMMNANTFTSVAVKLADAGNADAVANAVKDQVLNNQWMCGFPDKLVIANVGDCVVYAFGAEDLIASFTAAITSAYASATIVCEEAVVA